MADNKKSDPTVSSSSTASNVEKGRSGTDQPHAAVPVSEGADAAVNKEYADNKDKPDETTIAQVEVVD